MNPSEEDDIVVSAADGVALLQMNRPEAANALSTRLIAAIDATLAALDDNPSIKVVILNGVGHNFCAGADLKEMVSMTAQDVLESGFVGCSRQLAQMRKPVIAAVTGHALGGGCELVEMCDIVIAADNARFGHPEATVGTMPGGGGTQRLTRLLGRHMAMDLLLTGRLLTADEALRLGLVSRVVSPANVLAEACAVAGRIATLSAPVIRLIKEAVVHAGTSAADGVAFERRMFALTFALADRVEGMSAFIEKRPPCFADG